MPIRRIDPLEETDWPTWIPLVSLGVALLTIGLGVLQRGSPPAALTIVFALIAVSPFVYDAVGCAALNLHVPLYPLWAFPIPVLVGTALLVLRPATTDFAPFALCFVTGEITARAGEEQWVGRATALASAAVMIGVEVFGSYKGAYVWMVGIAFSYFGGLLIQGLDRKTHDLRAAQSQLSEQAAAEERSRIAREVHDVIAHSMSVTMLHVTAARMALEKDQSSAALESLREAETQGRKSLSDIRRTVGLLGPDESATAPPMPTAADLPKLVGDFRNAGLDVALDVTGDSGTIAPAAGLNLYRIVQESLTNVAKHAPGAEASVALTIDDDIRLLVRNSATNGARSVKVDGGGLGVPGMLERAEMLGGFLSAGPDGDGWLVSVVAPRTIVEHA